MTDYNRYQRFQRKQDNVNQIISARDVNELQGTLENVQQKVIGMKDVDFLHKCLFTLDHNPLVNAMWIDLMDDTSKADIRSSQGVHYFVEEGGWGFPPGSPDLSAVLYSKPYIVETRSQIRSFLLMVNAYIPAGSRFFFEVSADGSHWHPITPSYDNVMSITSWAGYTLRLRVRMERDNADIQPILYGWALLYHDPKVGVVQIDEDTIIAPPGSEDEVQPIRHSDLLDIGPDDHHPQAHSHDGTDGSGLVSHKHLLDIGPDDHHPKDHRHGQDGVSPVDLGEDVVGTLRLINMTPLVQTGFPGLVKMETDQQGRVSKIVTTESEIYLTYDAAGRLETIRTFFLVGSAAGYTALTTLDYTTTPPTIHTTIKDAQGVDIPVP